MTAQSAAAPTAPVPAQLVRCSATVLALLVQRRLHLRQDHVGEHVSVPDGRSFLVYRDTTCDDRRTIWVVLPCRSRTLTVSVAAVSLVAAVGNFQT